MNLKLIYLILIIKKLIKINEMLVQLKNLFLLIIIVSELLNKFHNLIF